MTSRIANASLWRSGDARIEWARGFMPVTTGIATALCDSGVVRGVRIGISDVLEPKTATLALLLAEAGADVTVSCAGRNTDDAVAAALDHAGIAVYANSSAGDDEDHDNVLALLKHRPEVIVDDGSWTIRLAHVAQPNLLDDTIGATEQTTSGVRPLRTMQGRGELRIPVIAANDARTKTLFDNAHGTGQAVVFAVLDLLDQPVAGRDVVIAGFGQVGGGIARHASALGARVTISEVDPVAALQAVFAGYPVQPLVEAAAHADILLSATGVAGTIDLEHLLALPDGAAVAVGGGVRHEIALDRAASEGAVEVSRTGKVSYLSLPNGRTIRVLDDGNCINVSAAEGNPVQIMDLSFGVQLAAVEHLLTVGRRLDVGVHTLPKALDDAVAARALLAYGGQIDTRSARQLDFLTTWNPKEEA